MKIITATLLALALAACAAAPAYAQGPVPKNCMANEAAAATNLLAAHGEVLTHMAIANIKGRHRGDHIMQIYVNPETRTWTGVVVHPASEGGFACQAGSGEAWLDMPPTATIPGNDV